MNVLQFTFGLLNGLAKQEEGFQRVVEALLKRNDSCSDLILNLIERISILGPALGLLFCFADEALNALGSHRNTVNPWIPLKDALQMSFQTLGRR